MSNGVCPKCRSVISSERSACTSCGTQLKISMIPKQNRVPKKEVGSIVVWQTVLSVLAVVQIVWWAFLGGYFALALGIGCIIAVCVMERPINQRWLSLCMEKEYRVEKSRQDRQKRQEEKKEQHQQATHNVAVSGERTEPYNTAVVSKDADKTSEPTSGVNYIELAKTLEQFKSMADAGVLTEEEFLKIKENILSGAIKNEPKGSDTSPTNSPGQAIVDPNDVSRIICPVCGTSQKNDRRICWNCGVELKK